MSQVDVLLVRPWAKSAVPYNSLVEDPLGVGYLAAVLRQVGFKVVLLDAFTFGFDDDEVIDCISQLSPKILGISLHSFADYKHTISISEAIAAKNPDIVRIVGGEHATFLAYEILERHQSVDAVVVGEGEETFKELVMNIVSGKRYAKVAGALIRNKDNTIIDGGARRAIEDLDSVPSPAKDIVDIAVQLGKTVAVSMLTGRGCTHKCTFCTAHNYLRLGGGVVWRRRNPVSVVDEMENLYIKYKNKPFVHPMIQFQDVIFLGTSSAARNWTEEFVNELEARNLKIPYYFMARAEAILANEHLLPRLASTGLSSVEIGIESGVDRILQAYNKQNLAVRSVDAIHLLQKNGICYDASGFIMFDPRITLDELKVNASYLRLLGHATWDRYITKLQVFPGTEIRTQFINEGLFDSTCDLDDVYAYRYEDPKVEELAHYVWMYDESIRELDNAMHNARSILAQHRYNDKPENPLGHCLVIAEDLYCSHFLTLIDLAEQGKLTIDFKKKTEDFLIKVNLTLNCLNDLIQSSTALHDGVEHKEEEAYFVSTPQEIIDKMLELAEIKNNDIVYDLGCGDGEIVISAARNYGVHTVGIDIDPIRIGESIENVKKNKLEHLIKIKHSDFLQADLSEADVLICNSVPKLNPNLIPQIKKLKFGSRIVSHAFDIEGFKPKKVIKYKPENESREYALYLWVTPLEAK